MPSVAAVIVNWNNAPDTLTCVTTLQEHDPEVDVIVVDNGSDDGSAELIAAGAPWVTLLRSPVNEGFTGGANWGLRHALEYGYAAVALVNSDVVVDGPTVSALARSVLRERLALAPRIVRADGGDLWFAGGVIDASGPRHLQADEVDGRPPGRYASEWLTGCCLVASGRVWHEVGLLDDSYFLFYEDCEWSARALRAGVSLAVDTTVELRHGGSRSFRGEAAMLGTYYHVRNGIRYRRACGVGGTAALLRAQATAPLRGRIDGADRLPAWPYGWIGAAAGLLGRAGPAPSWVRGRARAAARRRSAQPWRISDRAT